MKLKLKFLKEDNDPLYVLGHVGQYIGIMPRKPNVRPCYYILANIVQYIMYLNAFIVTSVFLVTDHPFIDKLESLQFVLSLIHMVCKFVNLNYNSANYRKLVASATEMWDEAIRRPNRDKQLLKEIR